MPDVGSTAPARVRTWVAIDQHKLSLVAAILPASGGTPEVVRLENTERAVRRFVQKLDGPRVWRSVMRRGRVAISCTACSPSWESRAM